MKTKVAKKSRVMGFTLLEMLGVMAVMAILASVAVPPMLRSLQNAQSVNEDKNLEEIGRALCEAIKAEGRVPNPTVAATAVGGWVAMAAPYCSMASDAIQYVFPGRTETERRYYILTLNGAPTLSSPASYAVGATGWRDVFGDWQGIKTSFLVLISSSKPDYLLACPANGSATYTSWAGSAGPAAVNWAAKQWVKQAVNGVYPATDTQIVGSSWTDKGQFLHVKVIPMINLICETTFAGAGSLFGINSTADNAIPSVAPFSRFTTRGAPVNVLNSGVSLTVTANSSLLNLVFSGSAWQVNP
jgi:prepilin-type N-terminal cleavage/methylation domain-containing protein